jgi:hypothetical protein
MADFSATYSAADEFILSGADYTYFFPANIMVKANCDGNIDWSPVESSEYTGGDTIVTLVSSILIDPVTSIWVSPVHPYAIPLHNHTDGKSGGDDVVGSPPDHSWSGTSLRFEQSDGSWGDYVDIQGSQGEKGDTGDTGAAGTPAPQDAVSIMKSTFSQASNVTIGVTDASDEVIRVWVNVTAAASGGSPTMTIGWSGNTSILVESSEVDLTTVGIYEITPMQAAASKTIIAYISADGQTFSGTIYAWYGQPS